MLRFSLGERPLSQALRAWTEKRRTPVAATTSTKRAMSS